MLYLAHKPSPPLSDFVDLFWLYEGYDVPHKRERLLPDGTVELVINLKQDRIRVYDSDHAEDFHTIPGCVVSGPRSEFFVIDTESEASTIGVHFKPGGAFPFFRFPPAELSNQSVGLDCLWGAASARLRERLLQTATPQQKFRVMESCLLDELRKPLQRHPAVSFALYQFLRRPQALSVSHVVEQVGFSQRRFIEIFDNEVGLTPKLFSRVSRFQKVIRTAHAQGDVNWTQLALDCGYYDQAHFIHDFQSFAGITPSQYLERRTPHVNHVPMEA
jgi:AraC-like DNA-binding protein